MRSLAFLALAVVTGGAAGLAGLGCSAPAAGDTEDSASRVTTEELTMAKEAVDLIAGDNAKCNSCHTAGRADVRRWGESMLTLAQTCFAQGTTPAQRVACLSDDPSDPASGYSASKLGLLSAGGAVLAPMFQQADPTGERLSAFKRAQMPMGANNAGMTAPEFQKIMKWVFAGMPAFNDVMGGPPEPEACVQNISPQLAAHVTRMKAEGWGARLADASTPMYGCTSPGGKATSCLGSLPEVTSTFGKSGVPQTMRKLLDLPRTSYWVRSSADGRYAGYGQFTSAAIVDLAAPPGSKPIGVDARYDPSFFPNNDGVSFAGSDLKSDAPGPIRVCRQSALTAAAQQPTPFLTLKETGCSSIIDTVYQSVGAALDGSVFWMSSGAHVNDDGGNQITAPLEGFEPDSRTVLTPMVSNGTGFEPKQSVTINTPLEGDQMLSPSGTLLVTRFGSKPGHTGFRIRSLTTTVSGSQIQANTEVIGTICGSGAKAMVSFDERFVVTHEYAAPGNAEGLPEKSANVVMTDLVTGDVVRLTTMKAGQYALYPHFRADGWMYFLVRDMNAGKETLVATDAAIKRQ